MFSDSKFQVSDILLVRDVYNKGENITDLLKKYYNKNYNTSNIIEIAYDLQSGSYIQNTLNNLEKCKSYTYEMSEIINKYMGQDSSILDIGTGEMTTLALMLTQLKNKPKNIYALDLSWSRLFKGLDFFSDFCKENINLIPIVADFEKIPLFDKSIEITISSHALEPNGKNIRNLVLEIFRVTRDKAILFEPCYEINSKEGKARMDKLGYIKNLAQTIIDLGGNIIEQIPLKNIANPLNPTVAYVVIPPNNIHKKDYEINDVNYTVPGTNYPLTFDDGFYFSNEVGLCFPVIKSIPILKLSSAILATAMSKD